MTPEEYLWNMCEEEAAMCRHHEDQRERMTGVIGAMAAGVLTLLAVANIRSTTAIALAAFLLVVGLFGTAMSLKHHERCVRHTRIRRAARQRLDEHFNSGAARDWLQGVDKANAEHKRTWSLVNRWNLYYFWAGLPALTALLGGIFLVLSATGKIP